MNRKDPFQYEKEIILVNVRWYLRYDLNLPEFRRNDGGMRIKY
jgi:transposase-like protein